MLYHLLLLLSTFDVYCALASETSVTLDAHSIAQRYDGHGALSAGASSRLLVDYPKEQREEILDLLFKPNHGMSLHTLKVEIGGDTQSTDGTEASYARSKAELEDCNVNRGYETWLMQEAKKRNPDIVISALAWGVPGWINSGDVAKPDYFNSDNIDYHVSWVKCVKEKLGINTDYIGIWNERPWGNTDYVTELRAALDQEGFNEATTGIVMLDGGGSTTLPVYKDFKQALMSNATFAKAVTAVGLHYPCNSPDTDIVNVAKKKFWASEELSTPADWGGAGCWGRTLNSNFVRMNMTSSISWSLIWSVYPNLDCFGNGLMYAYEPWSGHYEVNPTVWATAHTTQFTRVGWHYLSVGPGGGSGVLPGGGGTYVTIRETFPGPSFSWSLIVETMEGRCMYHGGCLRAETWNTTQKVTFKLLNFHSSKDSALHLWSTNSTHQFIQLPDVRLVGDTFSLEIAPDSIYTVSTTSGQSKAAGSAKPPPSVSFPLPYADNFDASENGGPARFWSDQAGVFEIDSSSTKVLRQVVLECPIAWSPNADPFTVAGGVNWTNYVVSVDAAIDGSTSNAIPETGCGGADGSNNNYVSLCGRITAWVGFQGGPISGYCLRVAKSGNWTLSAGWPTILASGTLPPKLLGQSDNWRHLSLAFAGTTVAASIDGQEVVKVSSTAFLIGMTALASGWHAAIFDNFSAEPLQPPALQQKALLGGVELLSFDYSKRTCLPHPESTTRLRNNFQGKIGLGFVVASGQDVQVTSLLRYMIDGNKERHSLELYEVLTDPTTQVSQISLLANTSVDMGNFAKSVSLDVLGFAAATLEEPVSLIAGRTYWLVSDEVEGGDKWMDMVPVTVNSQASNVFEIKGSVYYQSGKMVLEKAGSFAYGPVNLYYVTEDAQSSTNVTLIVMCCLAGVLLLLGICLAWRYRRGRNRIRIIDPSLVSLRNEVSSEPMQ